MIDFSIWRSGEVVTRLSAKQLLQGFDSPLRLHKHMLTPEQEKWVETLSEKPVSIIPYDPRSEKIFEIVKEKIKNALGSDVVVEHRGSSSLGISGQDEIDVQILAEKEMFPAMIDIHHKNYTNGVKFYDYLKGHPDKLDEYRILKENGSGLTTREYYRKKIEFINSVVNLEK